ALLQEVFDELVRRHEVLRTRIDLSAEQPRQQVQELPAGILKCIDLRGRNDAGPAAVSIVTAGAREIFLLERGPVLRAWLIRTGAQERLFGLVVHHIAGDQWSMGVLGRELVELYHARRRDP